MKTKTTLLIQTIGMYVMHLPLFVLLITLPMPMEFQEDFYNVLLTIFFVMMGLMVPICILNAVVSIKSALKGEENPTKVTMVAKLSLIPWYLLNFAVCVVFSSIFFNPFMMFAIPLIIALSGAMTYILMLTTSLGDIVYSIHVTAKKTEKISSKMTVAVVFLFIFCLDVLGAIILYRQSKKLSEQADTPVEQAQADAPAIEEKTEAPAEQPQTETPAEQEQDAPAEQN